MENGKLPPIPTPLSQRWREFRIQVLPFIVFIAAIVAIVYLWRNVVQPVGIVGFVETNQVSITSLQDGLISEIYVERFQQVKKDQPLGMVSNTDPELINAMMEAAKADLQVTLAREDVGLQRNAQNLQALFNSLLKEKIAQAPLRAELVLAETNVVSTGLLKTQGIQSELLYLAAVAKRDSIRDELKERDKFIADLEQKLSKMGSPDESIKSVVLDAIRKKEREIELLLKPSTLKAPFDGMIMMVHHRAGEKVVRGEPIISFAATNAANVVGYIRQPIQRHPQPGDLVQVTTRTTPRLSGMAQILKVGAQLEPINPGLLSAETARMEVGLPIIVSLPNKLNLLPGEFVDIAYVPRNGSTVAQ